MIKYNGTDEERLEFLIKNGLALNVLTIQDVIDCLSSFTPPNGRSLSDIPFGLMTSNKNPVVLFGDSKNNVLLVALTRAMPVLLNYKDNSGFVISSKDALLKEIKSIKNENKRLKAIIDKLAKVAKDIEIC